MDLKNNEVLEFKNMVNASLFLNKHKNTISCTYRRKSNYFVYCGYLVKVGD